MRIPVLNFFLRKHTVLLLWMKLIRKYAVYIFYTLII